MKKLVIFLVGATVSVAVYAHNKADGVVLDRMYAMETLSTIMKTVSPAVKSADELDIKAMKGQAAIMNTSLAVLKMSFPEGSLSDSSESSPKIWEDAEGFAKKMAELETAIDGFSQGVVDKNQEAIKAAFQDFSSTCKSCHSDYRIESF